MIDGRDFLLVANDLLAGDTEAKWRSAVSRAYYAAFHAARKFLTACGFSVPRAHVAHSYDWLRLANTGEPTTESAASGLNVLRGKRNQADYEIDATLSQAEAATQVRDANNVVRHLEAASSDPIKTQVMTAIKTYERDVLNEVTWHA